MGRRVLITLLSICLSSSILAAEPVTVTDNDENISLGDHLDLYEDDSGVESLTQVISRDTWTKPATPSLGFSPSPSPIWFRFVVNDESRIASWVLRFRYAMLDHVSLFIPNSDGTFTETRAGRMHPFTARHFPDRAVAFSIPKHQGVTVFYVRIQMDGSRIFGMHLLRTDAHARLMTAESIGYGIYFGMLIVMALYNISLFFSVRDSTYILYGLTTLTILLLQASITGYSFQYLFPNHPFVYRISTGIVLAAVPAVMSWFSIRFLELRRTVPLAFRLILLCMVLHGGLVTYCTFYNWALLTQIGTKTGFALAILLITSALIAHARGFRAARFYLIAWTGLLIGGALWLMQPLGLMKPSAITEYGFQVGSALEVLLLSLALGDRINIMKEEREIAQRQTLERQRVLTESYARFVPSEIMGLLHKRDITEVSLGDAIQQEMTILFSDIRSFTTLSESMTPKENFEFLNALMRRTGPVIREHGGFVDKFIGDAIMALFPEKAEDAVKAAIQMKRNLLAYNSRRVSQGFEPLKVGIGIHTGSVMLGTIGEPERMDGTVISDTVNLASRIEGLTKHYDATLLITQATLFRLEDPNQYKFRLIERVKVKGKSEPVSIFEIFEGDEEESVAAKTRTQGDFEHAVQAYQNAEFSVAAELFERVVGLNPQDLPAHLYLQKARHFAAQGVPPDWEGVAVMDSK